MDELRAQRAANFEARNVQNFVKDMHTKRVAIEEVLSSKCTNSIWMNCAQNAPQILKLGMYKTVRKICTGSLLQIKEYRALNVQTAFEARNVQTL